MQDFDVSAARISVDADCVTARVPYRSLVPGSIAAQEKAASAEAHSSIDADAHKQVRTTVTPCLSFNS